MSAYLWARECTVDRTANCRGDWSGWQETAYTTPGELFRFLRGEYGGKVGRMYRELEGGDIQVGWVFTRRMKYDDSPEMFLAEIWVEVSAAPVQIVRVQEGYISPWAGREAS